MKPNYSTDPGIPQQLLEDAEERIKKAPGPAVVVAMDHNRMVELMEQAREVTAKHLLTGISRVEALVVLATMIEMFRIVDRATAAQMDFTLGDIRSQVGPLLEVVVKRNRKA